jgi:hypothetical protein
MKRLAWIEIAAGRDAAAREAVDGMASHYRSASALNEASAFGDFFYFGLNVIKAEVWLSGQSTKRGHLSPDLVDETRHSLEASIAARPDFWNIVGEIELRLCVAVASGRLAAILKNLSHAFSDLHKRTNLSWLWTSVLEETRFTLGPYLRPPRRTSERQAALKLLHLLEQFATAPQLGPRHSQPRRNSRPSGTRRKP